MEFLVVIVRIMIVFNELIYCYGNFVYLFIKKGKKLKNWDIEVLKKKYKKWKCVGSCWVYYLGIGKIWKCNIYFFYRLGGFDLVL